FRAVAATEDGGWPRSLTPDSRQPPHLDDVVRPGRDGIFAIRRERHTDRPLPHRKRAQLLASDHVPHQPIGRFRACHQPPTVTGNGLIARSQAPLATSQQFTGPSSARVRSSLLSADMCSRAKPGFTLAGPLNSRCSLPSLTFHTFGICPRWPARTVVSVKR